MTVGLSGIGLGVLYLAFIALFIIILVVTIIRLLVEKSNTRQSFRDLKAARFFFANLLTAVFLLLAALILDKLKIKCLFLDRAGFVTFTTIFLGSYFVPFVFLAFFFKPAKKNLP